MVVKDSRSSPPSRSRTGAAAARGVRTHGQRAAVHPQLGVERPRPIAQEREVALVDLGERRRAAGRGRRRRRSARGRPRSARITSASSVLCECARAARHPQVLEAVLGEHREGRRARFGIARLQAGDAAREHPLAEQRDRQVLAEVERAPVEVQEAGRAVGGTPVAERGLARGEAVDLLVDAQRRAARRSARRRSCPPTLNAGRAEMTASRGSRQSALRRSARAALAGEQRLEPVRRRSAPARFPIAAADRLAQDRGQGWDDLELVDDDGHRLRTRTWARGR